MPEIIPIQFRRGTKAQLDAAADAGQLREGTPYWITDLRQIAIGVSENEYMLMRNVGMVVTGEKTL